MFNRFAIKHYLRLLALSLIITCLIMTINMLFPQYPLPGGAILLTGGFTISALTALLIFFNGFFSDREKSVFLTLIALGVKMLLSFVLALLFLLVFKNDSIGSIILFFILYLAFTVFVVFTFIGVLKKKSV